MNNKFKVGDRVKTNYHGLGTVVDAYNPKYGYPYAVNLDKEFDIGDFRTTEPYYIERKTDLCMERDLKLININNKNMKFIIKREEEEKSTPEVNLWLENRSDYVVLMGSSDGVVKTLMIFRDGRFKTSFNASLKGLDTDGRGKIKEIN